MVITGHMNYFSVNKCGLYRQNDKKPSGLELTETFKLIGEWVAGKPLADTLPWDSRSRSGISKCYCKDIYTSEDNRDILLVLWKSDTDDTGTLLGAREDAKTGEGDVVTYTNNYRGKKVIWGRPCYYWIIPSKQLVISIKFDHSVCDSQLFQDWVSASITNRVKHPNKKKEMTETGQTRLSFTDGTLGGEMRFRYLFDVHLKTIDTANSKLNELAQNVTHIIKRETISITPADERAKWVQLFDKVPYLKSQAKARVRHIEIRAEARPNASEIRDIIEKFANENRKQSDWDNVGFTTADNRTVWVDRYRLKNSMHFDHNMKGSISAVDLYEEIRKKRDSFLAPFLGSYSTVRTATAGTGS